MRWASGCCRPAAPPSCWPTPGLPVTEVAELTGFPEMLDGRVKTLHPKVHGGLLARRDLPEHMAALKAHGIDTIDLLVVNLYPFEATVAKPGCTLEDAIENIDIGGPAMVRSAAKNWKDVGVLTDASQYPQRAGRAEGRRQAERQDASSRFRWPRSTASATTTRPSATTSPASRKTAAHALFPAQSNGRFVKLQDLRYGENPHQQAAFYRDLYPAPGSLVTARQLQGKELVVQQHRRCRCGLGMRQELRRARLRDRQARQSVRRGAWARTRSRPTARPSRPIRPRPSAASSPSIARWTARRRRRSPSSSSKC